MDLLGQGYGFTGFGLWIYWVRTMDLLEQDYGFTGLGLWIYWVRTMDLLGQDYGFTGIGLWIYWVRTMDLLGQDYGFTGLGLSIYWIYQVRIIDLLGQAKKKICVFPISWSSKLGSVARDFCCCCFVCLLKPTSMLLPLKSHKLVSFFLTTYSLLII